MKNKIALHSNYIPPRCGRPRGSKWTNDRKNKQDVARKDSQNRVDWTEKWSRERRGLSGSRNSVKVALKSGLVLQMLRGLSILYTFQLPSGRPAHRFLRSDFLDRTMHTSWSLTSRARRCCNPDSSLPTRTLVRAIVRHKCRLIDAQAYWLTQCHRWMNRTLPPRPGG